MVNTKPAAAAADKSHVAKLSKTNSSKSYQWWRAEVGESCHLEIFNAMNALTKSQEPRQLQYMLSAWLYQSQSLLSFQPNFYKLQVRGWGDQELKYNICKSSIDALCAKIGKNDPMIYFLTKKGNIAQQQKAKMLTQFLWGLFDTTNTYIEGYKIFLDACVFGMGVFHYYADDDKVIHVERVIPDEILVDEVEAVHGKPRQLIRRKYVSEDELIELFPDFENDIRNNAVDNVLTGYDRIGKSVLVCEGWYLGKKKRLHTICINSKTLLLEKYDSKTFPFVFFNWDNPLDGFYGRSCIDILQDIQLEISQMMQSIQLSLFYFAVPRYVINNDSEVNIGHLGNSIDGQVITYQGDASKAPQFWSPGQIISGDVFKWLEGLIEKGYNEIGVSQLSATSQKPGGLDSGEALRVYSNIETERFITTGKRWERCFVELGTRLIDLSKKIYKNKEISIKVPGSKFLNSINTKDLDFEIDLFTLQAFPAALLSQSPAGKLQEAQELIQAGLIPPEMALSILQLPDIDGFINMQQGSIELALSQVHKILEEGITPTLNPYQDLDMTLKIATQTSVLVELDDNINKQNKQLLLTFCNTLADKLKPPPSPVPPGPPGASPGMPAAPLAPPPGPMAVPAPPPVSPYLPPNIKG